MLQRKKVFYSKFNLIKRKWHNSWLKRFVISDILVIKAAKILPFVLCNNGTQILTLISARKFVLDSFLDILF